MDPSANGTGPRAQAPLGRRERLYIAEGVAKNDREIADCGMRKKNPRGEHTAEPVGIPFAQGLTDVNAPFCAAAARRNRPPAGSLCAWKRILWKLATESALLVRVNPVRSRTFRPPGFVTLFRWAMWHDSPSRYSRFGAHGAGLRLVGSQLDGVDVPIGWR